MAFPHKSEKFIDVKGSFKTKESVQST